MKLQVLNPVAHKVEPKKSALAPRLAKLEGKLIGLSGYPPTANFLNQA
jgi:hypothetical protein